MALSLPAQDCHSCGAGLSASLRYANISMMHTRRAVYRRCRGRLNHTAVTRSRNATSQDTRTASGRACLSLLQLAVCSAVSLCSMQMPCAPHWALHRGEGLSPVAQTQDIVSSYHAADIPQFTSALHQGTHNLKQRAKVFGACCRNARLHISEVDGVCTSLGTTQSYKACSS